MLFATMRENPSRAASAVVSIAIVGAGDGARPEWQRVGFGGNRTQTFMVAAQRSGVREQKCATSTGCARRRCVYAGISASPQRSA